MIEREKKQLEKIQLRQVINEKEVGLYVFRRRKSSI